MQIKLRVYPALLLSTGTAAECGWPAQWPQWHASAAGAGQLA